jgi:hypothetical protein
MPGYSGTPLGKKLGIASGAKVVLLRAPADYADLVAPLPEGAALTRRFSASADLVHLFAERRVELEADLARCRAQLRPDAVVWVSWPKQASKRPTDITEDVIRTVALPMGFVDVKVCAVDDVWSGLKLVVRKELR